MTRNAGRPLGAEERALWARVIASVRPLTAPPPHPPAPPPSPAPPADPPLVTAAAARRGPVRSPPRPVPVPSPSAPPITPGHLDSTWDRRLARGAISPDLSVDLHGHGVAAAYQRLDQALDQARHEGLRIILLVTGRPRGHDRVNGSGRGAIRAAVADWLAASRHADAIAAVRPAHPRHGGDGALMIILRRPR